MIVLFLPILLFLRACNSPYMQDYFKQFFCFVFLGNDIFNSDQNVTVKLLGAPKHLHLIVSETGSKTDRITSQKVRNFEFSGYLIRKKMCMFYIFSQTIFHKLKMQAKSNRLQPRSALHVTTFE